MPEKRLKLGLDTNELANQLISINQLIAKNNLDAINGQSAYNTLLASTNQLLQDEVLLLERVNQNLQNNNIGNSGASVFPNGNNDDIKSLLEEIRDSVINLLDPIQQIQSNVENIQNRNGGGSSNNITPSGPPPIGGGTGSGVNSSGNQNDSASLQNATNRISSIAVQKNDIYMAAAAAAMIPIVGQGVGMVLQRVLGAGEKLDTARHSYYGISGMYGLDQDYSGIGLSEAEALQRASIYRRSNALTGTSSSNFYLEKGFSLDPSTVAELSRSIRSSDIAGGQWAAGESANFLLTQLQRKGGISGMETRSYAEEYLQTLVELNREQLLVSGEVFDVVNSNVLASIASLGKEFQNPEVLRFVTQGLTSGLRQAATPQVEALQYSVLSQISPNASLWELEKMRANPFKSDYLPKFLENIINISGGGEESYFNIGSIFPQLKGSPELIEKMVNSIKKGTFEKEFGKARFVKADRMSSIFDYSLEGEAAAATSTMQRLSAETENVVAEIGIPLIQSVDKTVEKIKDALEYVDGGFEKDIKEVISSLQRLLDYFGDPVKNFFVSSAKPNSVKGTKAPLK